MGEKPSARSLSNLVLVMLLLLLFCARIGFAKAEETMQHPKVRVSRVIEIENGGALVMNDTVTLSSDLGQRVIPLDGFQIGVSPEHGRSLAYFFAYDTSGTLQTALDSSAKGTELSEVDISFPKPIDVSAGRSYNFTVIYVFSGLVTARYEWFHVDLPSYPNLTGEASLYEVTVMFPAEAAIESASPDLLNTTIDSRLALYVEKRPLEAYTNVSSWAEFSAPNFLLLEVEEWKREIGLDGLGGCAATDLYRIVSRAGGNVASISLVLPANATDVSVQDVYGTYSRSNIVVRDYGEYVAVDVYPQKTWGTDGKMKLLIVYKLPFGAYGSRKGWQDYALNVSLIRPSWVLERFTMTVSLPEGAEFHSSSRTPYRLEKEGFGVKLTFTQNNVTRFHETTISLEYGYSVLWVLFRPALWVGTVTAILGGVLYARKAFRPVAEVTTPISLEVLRKFVRSYEERRRLRSELGNLEQAVQKGKISRRRYRLRKSAVDGRLSRLQRDLADLREEAEAMGGRYAERMKQLETAEAEIETLDRDIERVEARFRQGELSADARRRLLDEYSRIRERAENRIEEVLLRFREEIR